MARHQNQNTGASERSHEGSLDATSHHNTHRKDAEDDGDTIVKIDGGVPGMAHGGREGDHRPQMESGKSETCPGRANQAHRRPGREDGSGRTGGIGQGAHGGCTVSCHQAPQRTVPVAQPDDADGNWTKDGAIPSSMEESSQVEAIGRLGGSGSLHATGENPAEPPGPEASCLDQVLRLRLGNAGNYCYSNAVIRGLLHEACWLGGLESLFEGAMLRFLQSLIRKDGVIHLWANLFWRAQMGTWRAPARQHDAAEFLQFMLGKLTYTVDKLAVVWEARQPDDQGWFRTDGGQSAPWLLQPPLLAGTAPLTQVTVQGMIDDWHHQGSVHAAMFGPEALIVQVGRFDFDAHSDRALKRHFKLLPEPLLRSLCLCKELSREASHIT